MSRKLPRVLLALLCAGCGGGSSPQLSPQLRDSHDGPVKRLDLSESDKEALEAFLHTLTDSAILNDPKFSDPFL